MSLHLNGLSSPAGVGMDPGAFRNALRRVADPNMVGAGMVLSARGNVYGDTGRVSAAVKDRRRAANRRARAARRAAR